MPFVNLRNHRKVMVVDGRIGFTGGLNIGAENMLADNPPFRRARHAFPLRGPDRRAAHRRFRRRLAVHDRREAARPRTGFRRSRTVGEAFARVSSPPVPTRTWSRSSSWRCTPSRCAHKSVRVVTPYFLPPDPLTMALGLAALRGVKVDIVVPEHSNHAMLDWARRIPLRPLIEAGCRVWLTAAAVRSFQADGDRRRLGADRQRQLGHAQLPPELRAQCRAARRDFARHSGRDRARGAAASRWPSSTPIPCRSGCATAPPGCCSRISDSAYPPARIMIEARSRMRVSGRMPALPADRYSRPSRSRRIQRCSGRARRPLPGPSLRRAQLEPDRPVVGRTEGQRAGDAAGEPVRQAAVEPERHDVAGKCVGSRGPTSAKPGG